MIFTVGTFIATAVVSLLLEKLYPKIKQRPGLNLYISDFLSLGVRALGNLLTVAWTLAFISLLKNSLGIEQYYGPMKSVPIWAQCVGGLLFLDFCKYWLHRLYHTNSYLWRIHAAHHSIKTMYWMGTHRCNFLVEVVNVLFFGSLIVLCDFHESVLVLYHFGRLTITTLQHCNININAGFFNQIFVLWDAHHWHHSDQAEAIDKNFGDLFPYWDKLFGTYYMPAGKTATSFGVAPIPDFPEDFIGLQLSAFNYNQLKENSIKQSSKIKGEAHATT